MVRRSPESRQLQTTDEVLTALGGIDAVCTLIGIGGGEDRVVRQRRRRGYTAVWNWKNGDTFPSRYFLVMTWALKKKRLSAPPSLWGMVTTAEMEKAAA
jgi:hypothetical protein